MRFPEVRLDSKWCLPRISPRTSDPASFKNAARTRDLPEFRRNTICAWVHLAERAVIRHKCDLSIAVCVWRARERGGAHLSSSSSIVYAKNCPSSPFYSHTPGACMCRAISMTVTNCTAARVWHQSHTTPHRKHWRADRGMGMVKWATSRTGASLRSQCHPSLRGSTKRRWFITDIGLTKLHSSALDRDRCKKKHKKKTLGRLDGRKMGVMVTEGSVGPPPNRSPR